MTSSRSLPSYVALGFLVAGLALMAPAQAKNWGTSWFPIGPAPSTCYFAGAVSGRATAVALNPLNQFDVWVGTAGGGVWHTTNADPDPGSTWTWYPVSDQEASLAIGALALADCNGLGCTRIYAGTGENAIRRDTYYGKGLLFGTYSGCTGCAGIVNWSTIHSKGKGSDGITDWDFTYGSINNIVLDPTTTGPDPESQVIYITFSSGVTASASETTVTAPEPLKGSPRAGYGIYKSTDNGTTWDKLTVFSSEGARPTDLEIDPADHNILYAGFEGKGVFKTTDGGGCWSPLNPGIPKPSQCPMNGGTLLPNPTTTSFDHVEIAIEKDPTRHLHLYASFGMCPSPLTRECTPSIYETGNGGSVWSFNFKGSDQEPDPWGKCPAVYSRYTHGLTIWPGHPDVLFLTGLRLCRSPTNGRQWDSADSSLDPMCTSRAFTHPDHHALVFEANGGRAMDVNDGGVYSSIDGGLSWKSRNDTLQITEFQSMATSSRTGVILGGTQDNSAMLWTGGRQWESQGAAFGDAGYTVLDEDNQGNMYSTTNAGTGFVVPKKRINSGPWADASSDWFMVHEPSSIYYPPLVQSPTPTPNQNPPQHALYYGTNRLWRSDDDASTWTDVSPVLCNDPAEQPEIAAGVDVVSAIAVAPSDPARIYVGCYSGKVWVTDGACNQPACWYEMDIGLPPAPITWIAVDPLDKNTVVATLSGFFPGVHVYWHSGLAIKWFATGSITELNGVPANTISIESHGPTEPRVLWLGTDKGVYRSPNGGGTWSRYGTGLPNVPVYQISIDETHNRIVAGTHGRGAYMLSGPTLSNFNDLRVRPAGLRRRLPSQYRLLHEDRARTWVGVWHRPLHEGCRWRRPPDRQPGKPGHQQWRHLQQQAGGTGVPRRQVRRQRETRRLQSTHRPPRRRRRDLRDQGRGRSDRRLSGPDQSAEHLDGADGAPRAAAGAAVRDIHGGGSERGRRRAHRFRRCVRGGPHRRRLVRFRAGGAVRRRHLAGAVLGERAVRVDRHPLDGHAGRQRCGERKRRMPVGRCQRPVHSCRAGRG
jgi:hypothetical protein